MSQPEKTVESITLTSSMAQQVLAVFLVLGLVFGALWLLRRRGAQDFSGFFRRASTPKKMRVLEQLSLTPRHSLHLIEIANTILVVAVSPAGCCSLAHFPALTSVPNENVTAEPAANAAP